ncbi:MAG: GyrI-like domain-containing protein [Nitrososphaerales archaeon]
MDEQRVELVTLPWMRVASAWGFGTSPEEIAWNRLESWARRLGLFDVPAARVFGFNNPNPSEGSPNYGYEFVVTVGIEVEPAEGIRIGELHGGPYATMPAEFGKDPAVEIPAAWQRLDKWVAEHGYQMGHHQCLEEMDTNGQLKALWYAIQ